MTIPQSAFIETGNGCSNTAHMAAGFIKNGHEFISIFSASKFTNSKKTNFAIMNSITYAIRRVREFDGNLVSSSISKNKVLVTSPNKVYI